MSQRRELTAADGDVAIVGYGPTGVTTANMLASAGLRVVAIDRDANSYTRAQAISTEEEVGRIGQSIGLAERLKPVRRAVGYRPSVNFGPTSKGHWTGPGSVADQYR